MRSGACPGASRDLGALEREIEAHLQRSFGFEVHTFVRAEVIVSPSRIPRLMPFNEAAARAPSPGSACP